MGHGTWDMRHEAWGMPFEAEQYGVSEGLLERNGLQARVLELARQVLVRRLIKLFFKYPSPNQRLCECQRHVVQVTKAPLHLHKLDQQS
jgi:hypothetical protein